MNGSDNKHNNESTTATAARSTTSASHQSHQHQSKCLFRWPHQSMSQWSSPCPFVAASVALACLVAYPWRARLSQHQLLFLLPVPRIPSRLKLPCFHIVSTCFHRQLQYCRGDTLVRKVKGTVTLNPPESLHTKKHRTNRGWVSISGYGTKVLDVWVPKGQAWMGTFGCSLTLWGSVICRFFCFLLLLLALQFHRSESVPKTGLDASRDEKSRNHQVRFAGCQCKMKQRMPSTIIRTVLAVTLAASCGLDLFHIWFVNVCQTQRFHVNHRARSPKVFRRKKAIVQAQWAQLNGGTRVTTVAKSWLPLVTNGQCIETHDM